MRSVNHVRRAVAALGIAASALMTAPQAAMAEQRTLGYAAVAQDFAFRGVPRLLPAASYDTQFINIGQAPHVLVDINLGQSCANLSTGDLIALLDSGKTNANILAHCPDASFGGQIFANGGTSAEGTLSLTAGRNVFVCLVARHYALGMIAFTNVINVG